MNPLSYARYLSTYSTTRLGKKLGVSRQYISRLEQGLYEKPNDTIKTWTAETLNKSLPDDQQVTPDMVEQLYKEWQWQQRESTKLDLSLRPCSVTEFDEISQPKIMYYHKVFGQWRETYFISVHAFCVSMCLHPSPVAEYEEGISHKMPSNLKQVMNQLGLIGNKFKTNER